VYLDKNELLQVSVASPAAASGSGQFTSAPGACHADLPAVPDVITGASVAGSSSQTVNTEHCTTAWRGRETSQKNEPKEETSD